jgi:hypothetical protein
MATRPVRHPRTLRSTPRALGLGFRRSHPGRRYPWTASGLLPQDRASGPAVNLDGGLGGHGSPEDIRSATPTPQAPRHSARTAGAHLQEALPRRSGEGVPTATPGCLWGLYMPMRCPRLPVASRSLLLLDRALPRHWLCPRRSSRILASLGSLPHRDTHNQKTHGALCKTRRRAPRSCRRPARTAILDHVLKGFCISLNEPLHTAKRQQHQIEPHTGDHQVSPENLS